MMENNVLVALHRAYTVKILFYSPHQEESCGVINRIKYPIGQYSRDSISLQFFEKPAILGAYQGRKNNEKESILLIPQTLPEIQCEPKSS